MVRRRLLTTSFPKMFLGSLNQTRKIFIRSGQSWRKAFLRVLQNVLLLKMILIWRMWLKKSLWSMFLRKLQKAFVSSGCKGHVSMVISALTYTHGLVGISSKGWQSFKGTTRHSMELHFLKDATSFVQVAVMEQFGFGTAILVNVLM